MNESLNRLCDPAGVPPQTLVESGMARILAHIEGERPFAILTACRGELEPWENAERTAELAAVLRGMNLGYAHVDGAYVEDEGGEVVERNFFVIADAMMDPAEFRRAMANLGARHGQESVLVGSGGGEVVLVSTRDDGVGTPRGSETRLGRFSSIRVGDVFSEWKGKPFTFLGLTEGHAAVTRRLLGWSGGRLVQAKRERAARR